MSLILIACLIPPAVSSSPLNKTCRQILAPLPLPSSQIFTKEDAERLLLSEQDYNPPQDKLTKSMDYIMSHRFSSYEEAFKTLKLLLNVIASGQDKWEFRMMKDQYDNYGFVGKFGFSRILHRNGTIYKGKIDNIKSFEGIGPETILTYDLNYEIGFKPVGAFTLASEKL